MQTRRGTSAGFSVVVFILPHRASSIVPLFSSESVKNGKENGSGLIPLSSWDYPPPCCDSFSWKLSQSIHKSSVSSSPRRLERLLSQPSSPSAPPRHHYLCAASPELAFLGGSSHRRRRRPMIFASPTSPQINSLAHSE